MNSRDGARFAVSKASFASGVFATLAVMFYCISFFQHQYGNGKNQTVVLKTGAWSWTSDLRVGFAEGFFFGELEVPAHRNFEIAKLAHVAMGVKVSRRPDRAVRVVARSAPKKDKIALTQAAAVLVEPEPETPVTLDLAPVPQQLQRAEGATPDELEQMRAIHQKVLKGFKVSLNEAVKVNTQVAKIEPEPLFIVKVVNIQPEPLVVIAARPAAPKVAVKVVEAKKEVVPTVNLSPDASLEQKFKALLSSFEKTEPNAQAAVTNIQIKNIENTAPITDEVRTQAAAPMSIQEPGEVATIKDIRTEPGQLVAQEKVFEQLAPTQRVTPEYPKEVHPAVDTQNKKENPDTESRDFSGFVTGPSVAFAGGYSAVPNSDMDINLHFFDGKGSAPKADEPSGDSNVPAGEASAQSRGLLSVAVNAEPPAEDKSEAKPSAVSVGFVELFKSTDVVADATSSMMSREGTTSEGIIGWQIAQSASHWSTLYWGLAGGSPSPAIPLIHTNTAVLLARQNGVTLQADTGIIFGRVAHGWNIDVGGRAERPIYLTMSGQNVGAQEAEADRIFVALNVAPGAHEVVARRENASAGVLVAVSGGSATYLDLTQIKKETIAGTIYDASAAKRTKVGGIQVRVVGQNTAITATDTHGRFAIAPAFVFDQYPTFIETDGTTGFAHRYRFMPGKYQRLMLFRFSNEALHEWLDQLSGGVSALSGLIVAAYPKMAAERGMEGLYPNYLPLIPNSNLTPEVYTLTAEGQLQVQTPLKEGVTRFVAVQISEGPGVVQIYDKSRQLLWGEMTFVQPKVVNVVGEY